MLSGSETECKHVRVKSIMKPVNILLVEDNPDHALLLMNSLKRSGVHNSLHHVSDGSLALDYLRHTGEYANSEHQLPGLILMDIKMPNLGGIETLEIIKSDNVLKIIPVIMITTSSSQAEVNRCFELGANSYVTKPLNFGDFAEKIKQLNLYWILTSELPKT